MMHAGCHCFDLIVETSLSHFGKKLKFLEELLVNLLDTYSMKQPDLQYAEAIKMTPEA